MRVRTHTRILKTASAATLMFFSWSFGPLYAPVAAFAESQKTAAGGQPRSASAITKQQPEDRFEGVLESIREKVGRASEKLAKGEDDSAEIAALKAKKTEIDLLDSEIRKSFAKTEKKLQEAKLPQQILDRHSAFVRHYTDNYTQLKSEIDGIGAAKSKTDRKAKIEKAKEHLTRVKPPTRHQKLDPNNLPFRTRKATKAVAPRLKREDYERDFPKQHKAGKLAGLQAIFGEASLHKWAQTRNKPVLLAFNSPDSDIPFFLGAQTSTPQFAFADTAPFLLAQAADQPSADDLAETPEIQFTDAIRAKAQELNCSPVRIYEEIRNTIEFVPTYGSIQGADMCLLTKQCNAFDTSSLLISLLRSCNIPAHYVYSTVEMPIDKAMNWMGGFTDPRAAITFISSGGIPLKPYATGGVINKIQMEHVFVETYVPYGPYSGRSSNLNVDKIWVPLDPSYKQYTYTEGVDLQSAVPFDAQAFANQIQSTATINQTEGYATGVDSNYIQTTMAGYQTQVQNYISQNLPNATTGDIIGKKEIKKHELGILPVTLPYKTLTVGLKYSEVPDNLRHKVTFELQDSSTTGNSISYTINTPELTGKRLTLSYAPATTADEQVISNYGGIFSVPAYLVSMKSQIKIEGMTKATGNNIGLGNQQTFNMKFSSPSGVADSVVSNNVTVGAYYGIGINPSKITKDLIDKRRAKLEAVQSTVSDFTIYTDDYIGELIYTTAMAYFFELDALTDVIAKKSKVADLKHVSEAIVSKDVSVATLYGLPAKIADASMMIDVDRLVHSAIAQSGDQAKEYQFTMAAGQMSSAMEHGIFEQMYKAKGVSTIQVLQLANSQGIPIYTIASNNISSVLPLLQVPSELIADIQNAVNSGKTVVIPKQNITYFSWTGTGCIVMDPVTGSGAYMISTSLAGGGQCVAAGGLAVILLALIGSTGAGGAHSCTIIDIIHAYEVPLSFLALAVTGLNLSFYIGLEVLPLVGIAGTLLAAMNAVLLIGSIYIAYIALIAIIDIYLNHAFNGYQRRTYATGHDIKIG